MTIVENHKGIIAIIACAVVAAIMASIPVYATDGVIEINQAKVMAAGGFPYVISQPGSYRLTSNLTQSNSNTDVIQITSDSVTLDLNGFAIHGPTVCTGSPVTCSPKGSGAGISAGNNKYVKVHNGLVEGIGDFGIHLGDGAVVVNVIVKSNGSNGIDVEGNGTVSGCTVAANGGNGIIIWRDGTVIGNAITNNGSGVGIQIIGDGTVSDNTITGSDGDGIGIIGNGTVNDNTVSILDSSGIAVGGNGTVSGNTVTGNGSTTSCGYGIDISGNGTVRGNTVSNFCSHALSLGSSVGYVNNVLNVRTGYLGTAVSGGVNLGQNLCATSLCP